MPDHCRQRPRSCRSVRLARTRTANLVAHRPIHGFVPTPTTVLRAKAIASTAPARPPPDQRCGQFAIALAAPSVPYPPQFRALALFGRRPPERVVGIVGAGIRKPAHELPSTAGSNGAWIAIGYVKALEGGDATAGDHRGAHSALRFVGC